jgi:hypothetical protein
MPVDPSYNRNDATHSTLYNSAVYALAATGGFTMERGFATIKQYIPTAPVHVDVTDSVQIMMDVATFNSKLGAFNSVTDSFANNSITLSSSDLISGVTKGSQVFSVGKYATMYSDFTAYVGTYFGFVGGFSSLFTGASEFAIDSDNSFTGASFVRLLNGETLDASGQYINNLSGSITIGSITEILRYAVDANVFGNRDPSVNNWGISDGFQPGDLIWVPTGTQVTLKLGIDAEIFNPINNVGPSFGSALQASQDTSFTSPDGNFASATSATTTLITRELKAPLLIKLVTAATIAALPSV